MMQYTTLQIINKADNHMVSWAVCVWCVQELRWKISSQHVFMVKHVKLILDKYP